MESAMRRRVAQIVIFAACVLADKSPARAQSTPCPTRSTSASYAIKPSGPKISIVEVNFPGFLQLPISDQDQIADTIKQPDYGDSADGLINDAVERVKTRWQDRGYFKVRVSGEEATLTSSPASRNIALTFHVDEGLQYRLGGIKFKNSIVISDIAAWRSLFPISDGDIFSREEIATGLDNLRGAYGDLGYINFTAIPNAQVDDENKLVSLDIDVDEGKRFHVSEVKVLALDESARQELLKDLSIKRGQIYNAASRISLLKYDSVLPHCECREELHIDERAGAVTVTLDFRPCPTD
jgi:outer membrane protein assembly factor BamA